MAFIKGASVVRRMAIVAFAGLTLALAGCASYYVDGATKEIASSSYRKPATAQPVQVFSEFPTKGVPNAAATNLLKAQVVQKVKDSGLFSRVEEAPE